MRTSPQQMQEDAVDALAYALERVGVSAAPVHSEDDSGVDLMLEGPKMATRVAVKALSLADSGRIKTLLERAYASSKRQGQPLVVVVADELPETSRELLRKQGWGYLDRRGALWLRTEHMFVNDTSLAPITRTTVPDSSPIRGRVGLGVALWILLHPEGGVVTRALARRVQAAPSTVHEALKRLREHALIDADDSAMTPDLFGAVAAVWHPDRIPLARAPSEAEAVGWVVGASVGAADAGAPIVLAAGFPPDFYVPSPSLLRRSVRRFGQVEFAQRRCSVALAPTPLVTDPDFTYPNHGTNSEVIPLLAHPVIIALDLAQDPSRGREILADWNPEGIDRVW